MIISSFWANDLSYIISFLLSRAIYLGLGLVFYISGIASLFSINFDYIKKNVNNKFLKYILNILGFFIILVILAISIYGAIWMAEQHRRLPDIRFDSVSRSRFIPPDGFSAGCIFLFSVGIVLWGISSFMENGKKQKSIKEKLRENPFLSLNIRGVYTIAKIIETEVITKNYQWVTYEFYWKGERYINRVGRPRSLLREKYMVDRLFYLQLMKNDPKNNNLTDHFIESKSKLTIDDVPKRGWKQKEYLKLIQLK